ncbi:MAG: hypothetical protein L0215_10575 [Gemmataceae bacterium]|nr:hypothetical protein [Gemmataceae bacterium]
MKFTHWASCMLMFAVAAVLVSASGCAKEPPKKSGNGGKVEIAKGEHEHGEWWCAAHGIPEDICSLCNADYAAKCKKDGDWCNIHDRAQSQCFKCDPSKYAQFEKMYENKYGKKPEPPPESEFKK